MIQGVCVVYRHLAKSEQLYEVLCHLVAYRLQSHPTDPALQLHGAMSLQVAVA